MQGNGSHTNTHKLTKQETRNITTWKTQVGEDIKIKIKKGRKSLGNKTSKLREKKYK